MKRRLIILGLALSIVYLGILFAPAFLGGSVLDKSTNAFRGQMTSTGGRAMRARAQQTIRWAEKATGCKYLSICEIGPGRGVLAREAAARPGMYFAVDMDPCVLENVKGLAHGRYCGRVPPLPDEIPPVHTIVAENVLEHVADYAEARAFLAACRDKLRPGGCIVLRFPEIRESGWRFWEEAPDHAFVTTSRRMMNLLGEAGFSVQRQGLALDCFTGWRGWMVSRALRCFPWQTMHGLFYRPELSSPWSRLAAKTRHGYIVATRRIFDEDHQD